MYDDKSLEILEYHGSMLLDKERTESFLRTILKTVKPGDVVLDMGCGTGILSYFACMAGARRVYAVEQSPIITVAKLICKQNGFQDRVTFINDWSDKIDLPEKVDVIITETVGNLAFEEGILGWIIDAKKRFLEKGGQIIPRSLELVIVPVESVEYDDYIDIWKGEIYTMDFSPVLDKMVNNLLWVDFSPEEYLSNPRSLFKADLNSIENSDIESRASFVITRDGLLNGLGGWFTSELAPGVQVSNAPPLKTLSWNQVYFPIQERVPVHAGDLLRVELKGRQNSAQWEWKIFIIPSADTKPSGPQAVTFEHNSQSGRLRPLKTPLPQQKPNE
jgi:protein arginine N-methyltransferase 1